MLVGVAMLKYRNLGVRACANAGRGTCLLKLKFALYTARSAIALTRTVRILVLPHAVTAGASLYIEQENLIAGKPDQISILPLSLAWF